jgi:hypothetical protein
LIALDALATLILLALLIAGATPLILLALLFKDWISGRLW